MKKILSLILILSCLAPFSIFADSDIEEFYLNSDETVKLVRDKSKRLLEIYGNGKIDRKTFYDIMNQIYGDKLNWGLSKCYGCEGRPNEMGEKIVFKDVGVKLPDDSSELFFNSDFEAIEFNRQQKMENLTNISKIFNTVSDLKVYGVENWDVSNVKDFSEAFRFNKQRFINISKWKFSKDSNVDGFASDSTTFFNIQDKEPFYRIDYKLHKKAKTGFVNSGVFRYNLYGMDLNKFYYTEEAKSFLKNNKVDGKTYIITGLNSIKSTKKDYDFLREQLYRKVGNPNLDIEKLFKYHSGSNELKSYDELFNEYTSKISNTSISVNGTPVKLFTINAEDNNYVKLRDLAFILKDSNMKFEVGYDNDLKVISIEKGKSYTSNGSEMKEPQTIKGKKRELPVKIKNGDINDQLLSIKHNGENYFRLRDICEILDIDVQWNSSLGQIELKPY